LQTIENKGGESMRRFLQQISSKSSPIGGGGRPGPGAGRPQQS
jgi:hypothetical protein